MGRSPCCSKEGLNRGAWTASEDQILSDYIKTNGEGSWRNLPTRAGLKRCGKSCRLRWLNYLRPGIKRGNISSDEEELIVRLHKLLGNRWSLIAGRLPGRTDNEIKNYWNTNLAKKIQDHSTSSNSSRKNINHQSKEKKKPIVHSSNEARFRLNKVDSSSSSSPYVVRTKALRCTKLFFSPLTNNAETNGLSIQGPLEREGSVAGFSFLPSNKDDNYSTNLMEDFNNPGENCSFSADFSEFCDFDGVILGGDELSPINSDDSILFLDGILHNWNGGGDDCVHQAQPSCF